MNNRLLRNILICSFFICVILLVVYVSTNRTLNIITEDKAEPLLSKTEMEYVNSHEEISIYVPQDLQYLAEGEQDSYLQEYMTLILNNVNMNPVFVNDAEDADCRMEIVTPASREKNPDCSYTSPLFQIEGALFVIAGSEKKYQGYAVRDRLTEKRFYSVQIDNNELAIHEADSNYDAVRKAFDGGYGFVIGDIDAIYAMKKYSSELQRQEKVLYRRNVCLIFDNESTLFSIMNTAIQETDRHGLTFDLAEKWFDGHAPVYMDKRQFDFSPLIIVMFLSVLMAFLLYYFANKNLYKELSDRMNKLKESRRELKTTFNGVQYLLAELSLDGIITDINKAFWEYKNENIIGLFIWDVVRLDDDSLEAFMDMYASAEKGISGEGIETKVDNRIFSLNLFPIEGDTGQVEKMLFKGMDITGERMAERQMLQDNKMIAVGQLAAGVAHEIRNPLGIIRNYCYVIKTIDDEKIRQEAIEQIEKSVDSSNKIITNLLGFSRASGGVVHKINVKNTLESIAQLHLKSNQINHIRINIECDDNLSAEVLTESFNMILVNLISNGCDAIQDEGEISIKAEKSDGYLIVSVQDTGCGIPENMLGEIYNPFYTTKGNEGTGLGLYIVYNEIEKMNGSISVYSTIGEGTEFKLIIPVSESSDE